MFRMRKTKTVYLDGAANTPLDKEVFKAMKPYLVGYKGNSNAIHDFGIKSAEAVEKARDSISKSIGDAHKRFNVYFDSGATEGNNWIVIGLTLHLFKKKGSDFKENNYLICSSIEHASILNGCKYLKSLGFNVEFVKPNNQGVITAEAVEKIITKNEDKTPYLICIGAINNETGAYNEVTGICQVAHKCKARVLVDCTQAMSCGGSDVKICQKYHLADYMTFSSHKLYGPTGVGVLVKKKSAPLPVYMFGGNQEDKSRGGTHNVAGIVGMATAVKLLRCEYGQKKKYIDLNNYLMQQLDLLNKKYDATVFPVVEEHTPNIISLCIGHHYKFQQIANNLAILGVACSAGSACSNNEEKMTHSHVLLAMGFKPEETGNCFRVSFIKTSTRKDVDKLIQALDVIFSNNTEIQLRTIEEEEEKHEN